MITIKNFHNVRMGFDLSEVTNFNEYINYYLQAINQFINKEIYEVLLMFMCHVNVVSH